MANGQPRQFAWDCAFTPASSQDEVSAAAACSMMPRLHGPRKGVGGEVR
eukprot:COSAG01_NODE_3982_length_5467_cov_3.487891_7_plen_49_part_00